LGRSAARKRKASEADGPSFAMLIPTKTPTEEDIIKADLERIDQAMWAAFRELYPDLDKNASFDCFCAWCQDVNERFNRAVSELALEIFKRLN
jgi:hypothetical protein